MRGCPASPDEYIGPDGAPRAAWAASSMPLPRFRPADIERRFAAADRHLREAGVTYARPASTADRLWPLSHLPLLIDEADWRQLSAGIAQRAQLLEMVLRDLYGEGRLVAEGAVPAGGRLPAATNICAPFAASNRRAAAISISMPPMSAAVPTVAGGCSNDRTQAPSGAGYALENRLVLSRAFSNLYKSMNVERVAPFFEAFRDSLARQRRPRRAAHRTADAGRLQRNLFRARHAGALSRFPAGRGRRSRRQRRPHPYPHRRRV